MFSGLVQMLVSNVQFKLVFVLRRYTKQTRTTTTGTTTQQFHERTSTQCLSHYGKASTHGKQQEDEQSVCLPVFLHLPAFGPFFALSWSFVLTHTPKNQRNNSLIEITPVCWSIYILLFASPQKEKKKQREREKERESCLIWLVEGAP